jgi:hypothetical protein
MTNLRKVAEDSRMTRGALKHHVAPGTITIGVKR